MRRLAFVGFVVFFAAACTRNDNKPRILSREEMEKVTWDIMLVDEHAHGFFRDSTIKNHDKERLKFYLKVFQVHKITREDYNASLKYYASKPDQMKIIFDSLSARGERQRVLRNNTLVKPSTDSLQRTIQ